MWVIPTEPHRHAAILGMSSQERQGVDHGLVSQARPPCAEKGSGDTATVKSFSSPRNLGHSSGC